MGRKERGIEKDRGEGDTEGLRKIEEKERQKEKQRRRRDRKKDGEEGEIGRKIMTERGVEKDRVD